VKNNKEIGLDFIGGQTSLTASEEKALSNFFKQRKTSSNTKIKQRRSSSKRKKVFA
jgi:hypothetical protein